MENEFDRSLESNIICYILKRHNACILSKSKQAINKDTVFKCLTINQDYV